MSSDGIYTHKKKTNPHLSSDDRMILEKTKIILNENYANPPQLKELSHTLGINQQKLMTGFKLQNGMTIYSYIKRIRMEKAAALLAQSNLPVTEIGRTVGYHGDGHFQQAFRQLYGTTPGKFRRTCRQSYRLNAAPSGRTLAK